MKKVALLLILIFVMSPAVFSQIFLDAAETDWANIPVAIQAPDNTPGSYPADVKAAVNDIVDVKEVKAVIENDILYTQIKFWGGPAWPNSAVIEDQSGVMKVRHRGYYHLGIDLDNDATTGVNMFFYEAHYTPAGFLNSLNDPSIVIDPVGAEAAIMWGCDYEWTPVDGSEEPVVKYISYEWYDWSQNNWEIDDDRTLMIAGVEVDDPDTTDARAWVGIKTLAGSEVDVFKDDSTSTFFAGSGWGFDFIEIGMDLRPFMAYFGDANFIPGAVFGITPMIETPIDDWAVDVTTRGEVTYPGPALQRPIVFDGLENDWNDIPVAIDAPDNTPGSYPADVKAAVNDIVDVKQVKAMIEDDVLYTQLKFWGGPVWPNNAVIEDQSGVMKVRHRGYYHLGIDLDNDATTGVNMFFYEAHYTPAGFLNSLNDPNIVIDPVGAEAAIMWGCDYEWTPVDGSEEPVVKYIAYEWYDWSQNNWEIDDDRTLAIAAVEAPYPDTDKAMMWYGDMLIAGSEVDLYKDDSTSIFFAGSAFGYDFLELGMDLDPFIAYFGQELFTPGAVFGITPMIETPIDDWAVDVTTRGEVAYPGAAVTRSFIMDAKDFDWTNIPVAIDAPDNTPGSYPADVKAAVNDIVDIKQVKAVVENDVLYTQFIFWAGPAWPNNAVIEDQSGVMKVRHRGYYHLGIDLDNDATTGVNMFFYEAHYTPAGFLNSLNDPSIVIDPVGAEAAVMWGCDYEWTPVDGSEEPVVKYIAYEWYDWSQNNWEIDDDRTLAIAGVEITNPDTSKARKYSGYLTIAGSEVEEFKDDSTSMFYVGHGWGYDFLELAMDLEPLMVFFGTDNFQPGSVWGITPMIETPIDDWAVEVTTRGEVEYTTVTGVNDREMVAEKFELFNNYPNPFNPTTTIKFTTPKASKVKVAIYNMLGQKVRTLVDRTVSAGNHTIAWNGTDDMGNMLSSGVYLYRLESQFGTKVKKMTLIK